MHHQIQREEIKAAIAAWYVLAEDNTGIPTTVEEAKAAGYVTATLLFDPEF